VAWRRENDGVQGVERKLREEGEDGVLFSV